MLFFKKLIIALLSFTANFCLGQLDDKLIPFIHNIPFSDFTSEDVNKIDKNESGIFFMATHSGLVETDGKNHIKYDFGKQTNLEDIYVQNDSLIYSCGYGGFGKWIRSDLGKYTYNSIYYKEPNSSDYTQPIFSNILPYEDKIVFHAHDLLYFYDPSDNSYNIENAPDYLWKLFLVNDKLFAGNYSGDIFTYENQAFTQVLTLGLNSTNVVFFDSFRENDKLLITENGKLYTLQDSGRLVNEKILKNINVKSAVILDSNQIVIGTERNGIIILNDQFEFLDNITNEKGLSSNSIKSLFIDSKNIWVTTDLGTDVIIESIASVLSETGSLGSSNDYHLAGNTLLKATDTGLYEMDLTVANSNFSLITGSEGVNWDIEQVDDYIFIGHEKGIFTYQNGRFQVFHLSLGVWNFRQHPRDKNVIFCGTYNGILILKRKEEKWYFNNSLDGFWDSSRFMEFDKSNLWVCHPAKGFFLMTLSENFEEIESFVFYDQFKGDKNNSYSYFYKINDELVFYNSESFYKYEYSDKLFYESKKYNSIFSKLENFESFNTFDNHILFTTSGRLGILHDSDSVPKINLSSFGSKLIDSKGDFSKLSNIRDKYYIVNTNNRTLVYDIENENEKQKLNNTKDVPKPIVNRIYNKGMSFKKLLNWNQSGQQSISFEANTIEFDFFISNNIYNPHQVVEWKMQGDSIWNILPEQNKLTLSSLSTDKYDLQIRTNDLQGNHSEMLMYSFKVLPAWYFSSAAIVIYFILITLGFYILIYVYNINAEKQFLKIKREKLKLEVEKKSNELAFQAYTNIQKNKLLSTLKEYIFSSNNTNKKEGLPSNVRDIVNKIERQFRESNDWVKFDFHFKKANPDFFQKLNKLHPNLNANDKRICAFIKMQMPTKQMAEFLGINVKSLEMTRYRLRKKLALKDRSDLNQYLNNL